MIIMTCRRSRQGPGKVAIRPHLSDDPRRGPAPHDRVDPGREPDSSDRHVRTFGADRDFAGALQIEAFLHERDIDYVTYRDWQILDQYEVACGRDQGRPRIKVTTIPEMMEIIHQGR